MNVLQIRNKLKRQIWDRQSTLLSESYTKHVGGSCDNDSFILTIAPIGISESTDPVAIQARFDSIAKLEQMLVDLDVKGSVRLAEDEGHRIYINLPRDQNG